MPASAEGSRRASGVTPMSWNMAATIHMCRPSRPKLAGKKIAPRPASTSNASRPSVASSPNKPGGMLSICHRRKKAATRRISARWSQVEVMTR